MRTMTLPDFRLIQNLATISVMLGLFGILFAWFPVLGLVALPVAIVGVILAGSALGLGWERHVPIGLALLGLLVSLTAIAIAVSAIMITADLKTVPEHPMPVHGTAPNMDSGWRYP